MEGLLNISGRGLKISESTVEGEGPGTCPLYHSSQPASGPVLCVHKSCLIKVEGWKS